MFPTDLYLDQIVPDRRLAEAFGPAFDARPDQVAVISNNLVQQIARAWESTNTRIVLRTAAQTGSFPLVLGILLRGSKPVDFVRRLEAVAKGLGASLLTDDAVANVHSDSEYLLVGADGQSEIVYVDTEGWELDSPTFELTAESQRAYRRHSSVPLHSAG